MAVPSYDDLAPAIPDVGHGEVLTSVARLLPRSGTAVTQGAAASVAPTAVEPGLFAALHGAPRELLLAIAREFSPRCEALPGPTVVLDVAGLARLFGDAAAIAQALGRAGAPRVAVASTCTAAAILARAQAGLSVATGDPDAAVRHVDLAVLEAFVRETGAAPPRAPLTRLPFDALARWGLTTLGELAALPPGDIAARLGEAGAAVQRLARGIDPRPLVPDAGIRRFAGSFELEWPVETLEPLSFVFARMLEPLSSDLERADRAAIAVHLTLRLTDRTSHARTVAFPAPLRDPRVLRTVLLLDLESHPPAAAVDVVSLELDPAPSRIVQYSLLERALPSLETMATLMARLGALVGETRCGSPVLLETHRPDAWAMGEATFGNTDARREPGRSRGAGHARQGNARSEIPAADVTCEAPPCVLRRFRPPVAVRVTVQGGRPVRVAIERRGMPGGTVRQAAGPWRTSGHWWQEDRWDRDEWDVALSDGAVCRLFRDRSAGHWFLEGVFD